MVSILCLHSDFKVLQGSRPCQPNLWLVSKTLNSLCVCVCVCVCVCIVFLSVPLCQLTAQTVTLLTSSQLLWRQTKSEACMSKSEATTKRGAASYTHAAHPVCVCVCVCVEVE